MNWTWSLEDMITLEDLETGERIAVNSARKEYKDKLQYSSGRIADADAGQKYLYRLVNMVQPLDQVR